MTDLNFLERQTLYCTDDIRSLHPLPNPRFDSSRDPLPIGYALAWPDRISTPFGRIDWTTLGRLDFELPDLEACPCLALAYAAGRTGGTAPAWISAANEVAVEAFLEGQIAWRDIAAAIAATLDRHDGAPATDAAAVIDADSQARRIAHE